MRVRVRRTMAGPFGVILAGQEGDVPDALGAALVASREAEDITPGVAMVMETATAEPAMETTAAPPARRRKRLAEVS